MESLSDDDLAAIEQRCLVATPGPWWSWVEGRDGLAFDTFIGRGLDGARHGDLYLASDEGRVSAEDHDFIAHARQDVPALLAEVKRLRRLLAPMRMVVALARASHRPRESATDRAARSARFLLLRRKDRPAHSLDLSALAGVGAERC